MLCERSKLLRITIRRAQTLITAFTLTLRSFCAGRVSCHDPFKVLLTLALPLVSLDLMLTKRDGFEVLRHVPKTQRSRFPRLIVVSERLCNESPEVIDLGASEYIPKP